jgi:hypothetical protein
MGLSIHHVPDPDLTRQGDVSIDPSAAAAANAVGAALQSGTELPPASPYFMQAPLERVETRPRSASDASIRKRTSTFLTKRTITAIKSRYRPQGRIVLRARPRFIGEDRIEQVKKHAFDPKWIILALVCVMNFGNLLNYDIPAALSEVSDRRVCLCAIAMLR